MENFKRNNRFGGRRDGGGFSRQSSGRPEMHKVVCSTCGKDCEVPFKPSGDKPVYCNDCFKGRGNSEMRRFRGKDSERSNYREKRMYGAVCDKCGKKCEVPFRPSSDKPIYCSQCFDKRDKGKGSNQTSKQFEIINAKLDKILKSLSSAMAVEVKEKKKTIKNKDNKEGVPKKKEISKSKAKKAVLPKKTKAKKKK